MPRRPKQPVQSFPPPQIAEENPYYWFYGWLVDIPWAHSYLNGAISNETTVSDTKPSDEVFHSALMQVLRDTGSKAVVMAHCDPKQPKETAEAVFGLFACFNRRPMEELCLHHHTTLQDVVELITDIIGKEGNWYEISIIKETVRYKEPLTSSPALSQQSVVKAQPPKPRPLAERPAKKAKHSTTMSSKRTSSSPDDRTMSDTKRITLYAAVDSPFPHRVRLALEEAKATYDIIWIDLVEKPEWYEKKVYHGEGRVPYLVYGGPKLSPDEAPSADAVGIPDSPTILQFLADLFPAAALLPTDPVRCTQARLFAEFVDKKLLPAWFPTVFMGAPTDGLFAVLDEIQRKLPPAGFVLGGWSIADAAVLPVLLRMEHVWRMNPFTLREGEAAKALETFSSPRFARLREYVAENKKRESVTKTWNEADIERDFARRIDRFKRTGVINSDIRVPVPQARE